MVTTILLNFAMQMFYFVGMVALVGFLIYLLNRLFYFLVGRSRAVCYGTGFIGTPIHELSHALMCILFMHKIVEIKLFQIDNKTGVLGYVNHAYNKRNPYQLMGNFFIGIAPILCGTVIIYFMIRFMLPSAYENISAYLADLALLQAAGMNAAWFLGIFKTLGEMFVSVFGAISTGYLWWIFIVIVLCISIHMNLSGADIKGALKGLPFVVVIFLALNFALGFLPIYGGFTNFMNTAGSYLAGTLLLALVFSLFTVALGGLIRGIVELFRLILKKR